MESFCLRECLESLRGMEEARREPIECSRRLLLRESIKELHQIPEEIPSILEPSVPHVDLDT